ncbi:hypothetical protein MUP37_05120 [Candidatus Bathyarchaeota archaeon]|nr:hypothetical protein [Candidatus Bathyarchaeota archaeon]
MGFLKRILDGFKDSALQMTTDHYGMQRKVLTEELCENLHELGVKATLLEPDSPEAFTWPPYVLGCIKIEERNLDMMMIILSQDENGISYSYHYVVRANVDSLEEKLRANYKSSKPFRKPQKQDPEHLDNPARDDEHSSSYWEGGELAELLNADPDLPSPLNSEGFHSVSIRPDASRQCVRIMGRKRPLTREVFEAYNRIAYSIRRFIMESSVNPI